MKVRYDYESYLLFGHVQTTPSKVLNFEISDDNFQGDSSLAWFLKSYD